jgi:hypothetical protein
MSNVLEMLYYRFDLVMILLIAACLFWCLSRILVRYAFGLIVLFVLFINIVMLFETWRSGTSNHVLISGILPFSDSACYIDGSLQLLFNGELSAWASRRPITAFLEGFILLLFSANYRAMLITLVGVTSFAMAFAINETRLTFGSVAGVVMFSGLLAFYQRFIGSALSEHIGLLYGCLAFSFLLRSFRAQNYAYYLFSLFLLSVALNARAGAYFILPVLVLLFPILFRRSGRERWKMMICAILPVVLAFCLNIVIVRTLGHKDASMGNFSYTLYGLVHGGDWTQVLSDHPDIKQLDSVERYRRIYELSFDRIREQPTSIMRGGFRAYKDVLFSLRGLYSYVLFLPIERHVLYRESNISDAQRSQFQNVMRQPSLYFQTSFAIVIFLSLYVFTLFGAFLLFAKRDKLSLCLLAGNIGILASVPFVPPWDADWMRVYAATIPIALIIPAIGFQFCVGFCRRTRTAGNLQHTECNETKYPSGLVLFSSIVVCALLVALLIFNVSGNIGKPLLGALPAVANNIAVIPGSEVHLVEDGKESVLKNRVNVDVAVRNMKVFNHGYPLRGRYLESVLSSGTTLFLGYDTSTKRLLYMACNTADWNCIKCGETRWTLEEPEGEKIGNWRIVKPVYLNNSENTP